MKIYALFIAVGDGDDYTRFDLDNVFPTPDRAIERAYEYWKLQNKNEVEFAKDSMTDESPYYIGKRTECNNMCHWGYSGGYVIEELDVEVAPQIPDDLKEFIDWVFSAFDDYINDDDWKLYKRIFPDAKVVD